MKLTLLATTILLSGCTQLMNGATQPVVALKGGDMFTSCSGAVEDWSSCNAKANKTCPNGYEKLKYVESTVGGRRELTFRCK